MIDLSSWYQYFTAFNVSTALLFFNLIIFDPNWFLIDVHVAKKHFLIRVWMIILKVLHMFVSEMDKRSI